MGKAKLGRRKVKRDRGEHRYVVIMAGGNGTRLWPVSRKGKPKQFQSILGERTLLQTMYRLLRKSFEPDHIFVQVPKLYVPFVKEQISGVSVAQILVEPEARDTGPAFVFATASLMVRDPHAIVGFYYSDHLVQSEPAFHKALKTGFHAAERAPDYLVLIGVRPLYPHTGLGYIEFGKKIPIPGSRAHTLEVRSFIEKPALRRAKHFVATGRHLWNTGYKIGHVSHIFELLMRSSDTYREQAPRILRAIAEKRESAIKTMFSGLPRISFEYIVTEKADRLLAISSEMMWSDVGDWGAIEEVIKRGGRNAVQTIGRVAQHGSKNSLFVSSHRPIVGVGLENIIVVETKEGVLVMSKKKGHDMKQALEKLRAQNPESL